MESFRQFLSHRPLKPELFVTFHRNILDNRHRTSGYIWNRHVQLITQGALLRCTWHSVGGASRWTEPSQSRSRLTRAAWWKRLAKRSWVQIPVCMFLYGGESRLVVNSSYRHRAVAQGGNTRRGGNSSYKKQSYIFSKFYFNTFTGLFLFIPVKIDHLWRCIHT